MKELGLTKEGKAVYLALLELGKSTAGPIIQRSKSSSSKIYKVLARLSQKGLVSHIVEGKIKYFKAAKPQRLLDFIKQKKAKLKDKEKQLKEIMPKLEQKNKKSNQKYSAEIIKGTRGIKYFFELFLEETKKGETICIISYLKIASKIFYGFYKKFHERRIKQGVKGKVIYDYDAWFYKKRKKKDLQEERCLPKGILTPAFIYIFKDTVGTIIITEEQKMCVIIKNSEVAQSYKNYFNLL